MKCLFGASLLINMISFAINDIICIKIARRIHVQNRPYSYKSSAKLLELEPILISNDKQVKDSMREKA